VCISICASGSSSGGFELDNGVGSGRDGCGLGGAVVIAVVSKLCSLVLGRIIAVCSLTIRGRGKAIVGVGGDKGGAVIWGALLVCGVSWAAGGGWVRLFVALLTRGMVLGVVAVRCNVIERWRVRVIARGGAVAVAGAGGRGDGERGAGDILGGISVELRMRSAEDWGQSERVLFWGEGGGRGLTVSPV
jgi:hypothetical protein